MEMRDMVHRFNAWRCAMGRHLILPAVCVCMTALAVGCSSAKSSDAVEKAQIAVRANPALELVATDERQGVLTVKVKRSGQMLTVTATDVVAGTAFRDLDTGSGGTRTAGGGNSTGSSRVDVSTPKGTVSAGRSGSGVDVSTPEGQVSVKRSGDSVGVSTPEGQVGVRRSGDSVGGSTPEGQASARRPGSGVGVSTSEGRVDVKRSGDGVAVSTPEGQVAVKPSGGGLTVSTPEGLVNLGPGGIAVQGDSQRRARSSDSPGGGATIDDSRLERRTRPVSCVGSNSIDVSNVLLRVDDIAVETVGSCVVHIRNSHIAGDVAVQTTGSAVVTIENSIIEGRVALALRDSVMISVKSSTIRGAVQKGGATKLQDLGGNVWQ
jgi:hypothetical protein